MIPIRLRPRLLTRRPRWTTKCLSSGASDPLRILFCGSDDFSCAALEALDGERKRGGVVESVDVMVRPGKAVGRGNKKIREVPIKHLASELDLPIHEKDTFTGFTPPSFINLVIAVSFGRFVPPRILQGTKYGGLNVHPSFLPDLRGAAPLHYMLLQNRTHTGISVQTLDEKKFDHGKILAQTPRPGIPIPPDCTIPQLTDLVKGPAAELLLDSLRKGLHVNPVDIRGGEDGEATLAPRVTKNDRRINWDSSAEDIARRLRILGPLWSEVVNADGQTVRVIVRDVEELEAPSSEEGDWKAVVFLKSPEEGTGSVMVRYIEEADGAVVLALPGGGALRIGEIVVGGRGGRRAATVFKRFAA